MIIAKTSSISTAKLRVAKWCGVSLWLVPDEQYCPAWSVNITNEPSEATATMVISKMNVKVQNKKVIVESAFLKPSLSQDDDSPWSREVGALAGKTICRLACAWDAKNFRKAVDKAQTNFKRTLVQAGIVEAAQVNVITKKAKVPGHLKHILC